MIATQSESSARMRRATSARVVSGSTDSKFPGGRSLTFTIHSTSYFMGTIRCELFGGRL
jgi:hypothetical protein